jgi:hypothetical protein
MQTRLVKTVIFQRLAPEFLTANSENRNIKSQITGNFLRRIRERKKGEQGWF